MLVEILELPRIYLAIVQSFKIKVTSSIDSLLLKDLGTHQISLLISHKDIRLNLTLISKVAILLATLMKKVNRISLGRMLLSKVQGMIISLNSTCMMNLKKLNSLTNVVKLL